MGTIDIGKLVNMCNMASWILTIPVASVGKQVILRPTQSSKAGTKTERGNTMKGFPQERESCSTLEKGKLLFNQI